MPLGVLGWAKKVNFPPLCPVPALNTTWCLCQMGTSGPCALAFAAVQAELHLPALLSRPPALCLCGCGSLLLFCAHAALCMRVRGKPEGGRITPSLSIPAPEPSTGTSTSASPPCFLTSARSSSNSFWCCIGSRGDWEVPPTRSLAALRSRAPAGARRARKRAPRPPQRQVGTDRAQPC